jgi:hypothetical protein
VISRSPEEAVVDVRWQRLLDQGRNVPGVENSVQLTLRAGDRVVLDTVLPQEACSGGSVVFEARYMPRRFLAIRMGQAYGTARGGGGGRGIGVDGTSNEGGGGSRVSTGSGRMMVSGAGPGSPAGRPSPGTRLMDVDLWLVHSAPPRDDKVVHQVLRAPQEGADFAFAPVSIETPRGVVTVQVRGSFSVTADRKLIFVTNRRVIHTNQPPRDPAADTQGSGRTTNRMPSPDEVLSFEMPPVRGAHGDPALPDQFSVRVRIRPL